MGTDTQTQAETDREGMEAERRTEKGWRQRQTHGRDGESRTAGLVQNAVV